MANNKKESVSEKIVTGKAELTGFISIFEPSTKFNKDGVYSTNALISKEEGEKIAEKIKEIRKKQHKEYGKGTKITDYEACIPYVIEEKDDDGEVINSTPDKEGRYILKIKAKAYIKDGKPTNKIAVFDSKGKPISKASIGNGTIAKLCLILEGYSVAGKTAVSVKLKAVQILELVEFQGGTADSYGFEEEDGFEYDEASEDEAAENDEDDEEADF